MVTVKVVQSMNRPVTLAEIKADPRLSDMALVRQSRLSVTPVSPEHWAVVMALGQTSVQGPAL
jgi:predicted RNA-binding protein with PUA-like domain